MYFCLKNAEIISEKKREVRIDFSKNALEKVNYGIMKNNESSICDDLKGDEARETHEALEGIGELEGLDGLGKNAIIKKSKAQEAVEFILSTSSPLPKSLIEELSAHLLMHFASFSSLCDAERDELKKLIEISDPAIELFRVIPGLASICCNKFDKNRELCGLDIKNIPLICKKLIAVCAAEKNEKTIILPFSNGKCLGSSVVACGTQRDSELSLHNAARTIFLGRASSFILVHNHLYGSTEPSKADMDLTFNAMNVFAKFGITMDESIVIAGNRYLEIFKMICEEGKRIKRQSEESDDHLMPDR